ncbi:MAG: hypothetical protein COB02_09990 [Candidatus Cloacimonadota bacterium]|nr:MAG: hypothetical protein COB02_09990 [Candidatus Cloacimonadota bacterium]
MYKLYLIVFILIFFTGCKKKQTPIGRIPVPNFKKKIDLLPSLINVRYNNKSSGIDSCKKCHSKIYEEWSSSLHSMSTISESFIKGSNNYKFIECMSCHAPLGPELNEQRPKERGFNLHEGITCSSCHVIGNRTLGPIGSNAPHGVKKTSSFLNSTICQSCHQQTYLEWKTSGLQNEGLTCQACHMPTIKRYISNHSKGIYNKKLSTRHTFEIEFKDSLKMNFKMSSLIKNQITLQVENTGSGHDYPTGTYGDNTLFIELKIMDNEQIVFFREEALNARDKTSIKAKEKRNFFYTFRPPKKKSYLMIARAFYSSSNLKEDVKLVEIERYLKFE